VTFVHSRAHDVENRAARVAVWLESATTLPDPTADDLVRRTSALMVLGFRNFDALHVACAEFAGADVFATTDDQLLSFANRHATLLRVRVVDVVTLAREVLS
jgi:predicted nucleic acid-binding protein